MGRVLSTTVEHDVEQVGDSSPERLRARFLITERFPSLGSPAGQIDVLTRLHGQSLGFAFQVGGTYMVVAQRWKDRLFTSECHGTKSISDAGEDLAYLRSIPHLPQVGQMDGFVTNEYTSSKGRTWVPWWAYTIAQQLLPPELERYLLGGLPVRLDGGGTSRFAVTDGGGGFHFWNLVPGMYTLHLEQKGLEFTSNRPFRIVPGAKHELWFSAEVSRTIQGTVKTALGSAAPNVQVDLTQVPKEGNSRSPWPTVTDEHGHFEFRNIQSGTYYLGVSLRSTPPDRWHPYVPWYYPGTADPKRATMLRVGSKPAPETQEANFTLPPALFSDTVKVLVLAPDGQWVRSAEIFVYDVQASRESTLRCCTSTGTPAFRAFEKRLYRIQAFAEMGTESWLTRRLALNFEASTPRTLKLVLAEHGEQKTREAFEQMYKP